MYRGGCRGVRVCVRVFLHIHMYFLGLCLIVCNLFLAAQTATFIFMRSPERVGAIYSNTFCMCVRVFVCA